MRPALRLHLAVAAEPVQIRLVRRVTERFLAAAGWPPGQADTAVFAVAEAVSNCVEHAYRGLDAGRMTVDLAVEPAGPGRGRVVAVVTDFGSWRPNDDLHVPGSGLELVRAVSESVDLTTNGTGTRVTIRSTPVDLPR